jgi:pyridoxine 4-dehydrogenase
MTDVSGSGTFKIGGDLEVHRLGFGAMRIVGEGIWGPPPDHDRAIAVLRRTRELGIDLVDTADSYGPFISEDLIAEALHPYGSVAVATKGGFTRHGPDVWRIVGRWEYLRQCCLMSLRRLKVDTIDLWQLHRIDDREPREEQLGEMRKLQQEAQGHFEVTTVQNRYNLADRSAEDVLDYCTEQGIGFIPWAPLDAGKLADPGGPVAEAAQRHDATPGQVALAWLLARSPVMLPIPGTGSVEHLEENAAAADLQLDASELEAIAAAAG